MSEDRERLVEAMARTMYEHREGPVANADFGRQQALWHDCLLQAKAVLAAIESAGWRVVPVEPTKAMQEEALEVMRLQEQLSAARYALDMAEALLRRVDVAGGGSSTTILHEKMYRYSQGSARAHLAAMDWRKDRDAWLEARP